MGMAASQARFLGLTARKTNVEYEGQQINQQRTTLGNQSANYYNQLLGMAVPVPPSVQDYTKTVYTFQDGNLNNNITALVAQSNGMYKVSYVSSWQNDFAPVSAGAAIVFRDTNTTPVSYKVGNQTLRTLLNRTNASSHGVDPDTGAYSRSKTDPDYDSYIASLTDEQRLKLIEQETQYEKMFDEKYKGDTSKDDWFCRYVLNTTSGVYEPIFYQKDVVTSAIYNKETGASQSNIPSYKIGSATETEEVKGVDARLEKDATGRYINITLILDNGSGEKVELTYALTTSTTTDQAAYNDAMNQYEFDKYTYDQSIQEINAKIEIVQAEDRNLELRLKQLDTEQDAIQTEMDAVQKVIEKNTESTFKTFG